MISVYLLLDWLVMSRVFEHCAYSLNVTQEGGNHKKLLFSNDCIIMNRV